MDELPLHILPKTARAKEYAVTSHYVPIEAGVSVETALNPNFWTHLAYRFKVSDEVTVRPADGAWRLIAEVMAVDPMQHWVVLRTMLLTQGEGQALGASDNDGYAIHHDPVQQYRILRGRDLVEHGFATEDEARVRLAELKARGEAPKPRKVA